MKIRRPKAPWVVISGALMLMVAILALVYQASPLRASADLGQLVLPNACLLAIALGSSYAVLRSLRARTRMEQELAAKSGALEKSHEKLMVALEDLEAVRTFQQSIIDGVGDSIIVVGADYRVQLMNRAARAFSFGRADPSGPMFCYQISHHNDAPCRGTLHPCPMDRVRASGRPIKVVHQHYQANGELCYFELIASPLWGANGAFQGIIESMRDITQRNEAETAQKEYAERLRALTGQLAEVREAERQQLARELHDRVGQNLTALGINLNILRSQMARDASAPVLSRLDDSLSLVEQTAEHIRDVMANLRPPVLDDYGLVAALHWYGQQFAGRTHIAVTVEGTEPVPRLAARVENAMFRIAQEALTNVAKHARASQVCVKVEAGGETVRLAIADDGVGFDPARASESAGCARWGLLTMSERAEVVGGRCWVESDPGQGTRAIVEVVR